MHHIPYFFGKQGACFLVCSVLHTRLLHNKSSVTVNDELIVTYVVVSEVAEEVVRAVRRWRTQLRPGRTCEC